jgi:diguanylate cyclase (GGDEF)-like protein
MTKGTIICVDDERTFLLSLRDQIRRILTADYSIELAESGEEALCLLADLQAEGIEVPLLICDQTMPEMDGISLLNAVQSQYPDTLKIMLTGLANLDNLAPTLDAVKLYRYIPKPWDEADLRLTIREALRSYTQNQQLILQNQALQREINDRRRAEAQLAHAALHDSLTQLPNRDFLIAQIDHSLTLASQDPHYCFALLFIDLDRFKIVNDSLGHMVGDKFLQAIAQRFRHCLRDADIIARFGGDEFSVMLPNLQNYDVAVQVAERLLSSLQEPLHVHDHTLFASASIGIALGASTYTNAVDLLRDADLAMYRAKRQGRSGYALFNPDLHTQSLKFLQLENDLRQALANQEFTLNYQPIVALTHSASGTVAPSLVGFEALVRWQHPTRGFISPADFIPVAEETGLIVALGEWVLLEACQQMRQWQLAFPICRDLSMSVNLAGQQLQSADFIEKIDQILSQTGLPGHNLALELTERMLMDHVADVLETLSALRARNILLSIDDFGTGYSSLSYLPRFPVSHLKIDRAFVDGMISESENLEVVRAITTLAHSLGMKVVAEGIETQPQMELLQSLNCEYGQGYLFSRPLPAGAAEQFIDHHFAHEIEETDTDLDVVETNLAIPV